MTATIYDEQFASIRHYQLYPKLYPWVGEAFDGSPRILILGESHYLKPTSTYHHKADEWYAGVDLGAAKDTGHMNTRGIIRSGLESRWKEKSKLIYRNIEAALQDAQLDVPVGSSPFQRIAYMNYFQRPAQVSGQSIVVTELDKQHSAAVLNSVLEVLRPEVVIFCSGLAWRAANNQGLPGSPANKHIRFGSTTHPSTSWWHRGMRKYNGRSGRQVFMQMFESVE